MKKIFSLILILLAYFFTINSSYCEEDFFIDSNFTEAKNKPTIPAKKVADAIEKTKKKNWFSKEKIKTKFNYTTNKEEEIPQGYYGTLPNINADFAYKKQVSTATSQTDMKVIEDGEIDEKNLKPAPFDDALFLDVIIKKEKDSDYVKDIQKTKLALENLKKCIEEKGDIQRFNGCVNMLEMYVQNLKNKYENKNESQKDSFIEAINTNYYAKILGNLKYDSNYYSKYIPTNQGKYSKENISLEEEQLLNRINKTLLLLYEES